MNTNKDNGFTLTEVMISVALVGLIIGLSIASWTALARAATISKQWSGSHAELREAFDIMSKDIMGASDVHSWNTNWFAVTTVTTNGPKLRAYVYVPNDQRLWRVRSDKPDLLVEDVSSFSFTMYEEDGLTETADPDLAFSIDVTVETEKTVAGEVFDDVFQTRAMLRNKLL